MTRNEYIASIMLEAADLLNESGGVDVLDEDTQNYYMMIETVNKANSLCETVDKLMYKLKYKYEYALNEGAGETVGNALKAIWNFIKKIGAAIRDAAKAIWKFLTGGNKNKKAAKKGKVVDAKEAKSAVNKAYSDTMKVMNGSADKESAEDSIQAVKEVTSDVNINEGDIIPSYEDTLKSIEQMTNNVEKTSERILNSEEDEKIRKEKLKTAQEFLSAIQKMESEIAKSTKVLALPAGNGARGYSEVMDKDGNMVIHDPRKDYVSYVRQPNGKTRAVTPGGNTIYRNADGSHIKTIGRYADGVYYRSNKNVGYDDDDLGHDIHDINHDTKSGPTVYVDRGNNVRNRPKKASNMKKQLNKQLQRGDITKQEYDEAMKRLTKHEAIELLYDQMTLTESVAELEILLNAMRALSVY